MDEIVFLTWNVLKQKLDGRVGLLHPQGKSYYPEIQRASISSQELEEAAKKRFDFEKGITGGTRAEKRRNG